MKKEPKDPSWKSTKVTSVTASSKKKLGASIPVKDQFFIVGMGGSAGSLEAFEKFFRNMPGDSGVAFVVISHLDPTQKGMMPELLQRYTSMKVFESADGMRVMPNCVYVIPSNKDMAILHGTLQLLEPTATRGLRLPIDFFLKHLGQDKKKDGGRSHHFPDGDRRHCRIEDRQRATRNGYGAGSGIGKVRQHASQCH